VPDTIVTEPSAWDDDRADEWTAPETNLLQFVPNKWDRGESGVPATNVAPSEKQRKNVQALYGTAGTSLFKSNTSIILPVGTEDTNIVIKALRVMIRDTHYGTAFIYLPVTDDYAVMRFRTTPTNAYSALRAFFGETLLRELFEISPCGCLESPRAVLADLAPPSAW
jgi:hypothetical protein